jgi:hypothetical protein
MHSPLPLLHASDSACATSGCKPGFTVEVWLNGRAWLARQMDRVCIDYTQRDNCFIRVAEPQRAKACWNPS